MVELLLAQPAVEQTYDDAIGVSYEVMHADPEAALSEIVRRFHEMVGRFDVLLVLGSDYTDVSTPTELAFNAKVAANLGSPVVLVVHGRGRTPDQVRMAADFALTELVAAHALPVAIIANRVDPEELSGVRDGAGPRFGAAGRRRSPRCRCWWRPTVAALLAGVRRAVGAGQPGLAGPRVARVRRRRHVAAECADPAARGRHGDRARAIGTTCCPDW